MEPTVTIQIYVLSDGRTLVRAGEVDNASPITDVSKGDDLPHPQVKNILLRCNRYTFNGNQCCEKVKCRMRGIYKGVPLEIPAEKKKPVIWDTEIQNKKDG